MSRGQVRGNRNRQQSTAASPVRFHSLWLRWTCGLSLGQTRHCGCRPACPPSQANEGHSRRDAVALPARPAGSGAPVASANSSRPAEWELSASSSLGRLTRARRVGAGQPARLGGTEGESRRCGRFCWSATTACLGNAGAHSPHGRARTEEEWVRVASCDHRVPVAWSVESENGGRTPPPDRSQWSARKRPSDPGKRAARGS